MKPEKCFCIKVNRLDFVFLTLHISHNFRYHISHNLYNDNIEKESLAKFFELKEACRDYFL